MELREQSLYTNFILDNDNHYHDKGEEIMLNKWKNRLLFTGALSVMLIASACGNHNAGRGASTNAPSGENQTPVKAFQQEEGAPSAGTRIITTIKGDIEIPTHPQRIVITFQQGDLLALGIKAVGTSFNDDAVFEEELGDTSIGIPWETDLETIMALEPDLIIFNRDENYEKLSLIAPTIILPDLYDQNPLERLRMLGDLVGKKEEAEALVAQFNTKVADSKAKLEAAGLTKHTVSLMEFEEEDTYIYGNNFGRGGQLLYNYLGMRAPQKVIDDIIEHPDKPKYLDISKEVLADYQGDFIFSNENLVLMENNPIWQNLTAVKEGRVIQTNTGMFWFTDILSMNAQLDFIMDNLLKYAEQ